MKKLIRTLLSSVLAITLLPVGASVLRAETVCAGCRAYYEYRCREMCFPWDGNPVKWSGEQYRIVDCPSEYEECERNFYMYNFYCSQVTCGGTE